MERKSKEKQMKKKKKHLKKQERSDVGEEGERK